MLGAGVAEANGCLGLVVLSANVDDDTLAEGWVLDVVAEPQPDHLRVRRRRLLVSLTGDEGSFDHTIAMPIGLTVVVAVDASVRRRVGPLRRAADSSAARRSCVR